MRIIFKILGTLVFATWIAIAGWGWKQQQMYRSLGTPGTPYSAKDAFGQRLPVATPTRGGFSDRPTWGGHTDPYAFAQGGSNRPGRPMMRATPTR